MLALLAEMARAEKETLIERIRSGLDKARRNGVKLGRPAGSTQGDDGLLAKHPDVVRPLRAGQSVRNAAKITGKGGSTVQRVKAALARRGGGIRGESKSAVRLTAEIAVAPLGPAQVSNPQASIEPYVLA